MGSWDAPARMVGNVDATPDVATISGDVREWFASRMGTRVRLTRRAALTRDENIEFVVDTNTVLPVGGTGCTVSTNRWMMCYDNDDQCVVLDGALHVHTVSGAGHHFFDVYESM